MPVSRLRLETTSIFHYIKDQVISVNFSESLAEEPLVYDRGLDAYVLETDTKPTIGSEGRGFVYFDDYQVNGKDIADISQEQNNKVSVTGASNYTINYSGGYITNPDTVPTEIDFYWDYISVIPRWPGVTPPPLPVVSIGIESSKKTGFQLGGGVRNVRTVYFHVFATSDAERDDISEVIHSSIHNRTVSILDYSDGVYLNHDGTFNTSLSLPLASIGSMFFSEASQKNIYTSSDWSDLNKYRSVIAGVYESFVDSE